MSRKYCHISVPDHIMRDLTSRRINTSEVLRNALQLTKLEPKYLYEISYKRDNVFYYVIVDNIGETYAIEECFKIPYFSSKSLVVGNGELDIRLIGCFEKMFDALKVLNIYVNTELDKGSNVLNTNYSRMIHFKVDNINVINKAIKTDKDLSYLLTELINTINLDTDSEFSIRVRNSINKVKNIMNL